MRIFKRLAKINIFFKYYFFCFLALNGISAKLLRGEIILFFDLMAKCLTMLATMIPKVFYTDINVGLDLFSRYLSFEIFHQDSAISVLGRNGVKVYLMQSAELTPQDRPELAIETDNKEIKTRAPEIRHPNSKVIERKP